jgi:hypothetical protein
MITHCICYDLSIKDIVNLLVDKTLEDLDICDRCRLCNPYIEESLKTGITEFPVDYFDRSHK